MPDPGRFKTRTAFMEACIPEVLRDGTAESRAQAVAVCRSMWDRRGVAKRGAARIVAPLYVSRPVLNAGEVRAWAKAQGFASVVEDLHVTVAYSRRAVDWTRLQPDTTVLPCWSGRRTVEPLGDEGAVVLRFEDRRLQARWRELLAAGASWDYPSYQPHVTVSYRAGELDLAGVEPFDGGLWLGPEKWAPIDDGHEIVEKQEAFPRIPLPDPELESVARLAALLEAAEPRVERRFLEAVARARRLTELERLSELIAAGRIDQAMEVGETLIPEMTSLLESLYAAAGISAAQGFRAHTGRALEFSGFSSRAARHTTLVRARLSEEFVAQQRLATETLVRDGVQRGLPPIEIARRIRESIGLAPAQARAVDNYRRLLEEGSADALRRELRDRRFDPTLRRAVRGDQALTAAQIDRMTERYRERQLGFRARTLALNESQSAIQAADDELWRQAVDAGVDSGAITQRWVTAGDELVRTSHRAMNGQTRPFGQRFRSGNGNFLRYPHDPEAPISETVRCRCVVDRRLRQSDEAVASLPVAAA